PLGPVLGVVLGCVHIRIHAARREERNYFAPRVVRPRGAVEPFDDAAHGERPAHNDMAPSLRRPWLRCVRTATTVVRPHSVQNVNEPLDALAVHAQSAPDKVAVIVDDSGGARPSSTTFGELNALVNRLAHGLLAAGASSGDRLVWCGPNSLE